MDLGIRGKRAIVCAASKGLGRGCAEALAEAGVDLVINARGAEALEATAAAIRARHGVEVTAVAADITTEDGRAAVLAACPEPDILVTNAGGPPPGHLVGLEPRRLHPRDRRQHADADRADAGDAAGDDRARLGPGGQHHLGRGQGADPALGLSNTARTGLTGFVAGTSRQVAPHGRDDQQPAARHPRHRPRRRRSTGR